MTFIDLSWRIARLRYLLQRVAGSFARRGLHGTLERIAQEFRPRATVRAPWQLEPLDQPFSPFELPVSDAPRVSVIIPIHGKLAYTLACLRSIAHHGADAPFEVIVVDDASPDDSAETLAKVGGLRLLRNERNLGFVGSCNAGAAAARGDYLLFLNNDTQVTPGWLDRLLDCFGEEPHCGLVGSRLVYPDGRLQEAGGIIFADASGWNFGRFADPNDPQFRYRRDADYVSGASILIETALFRALGGFDTRYAPAYYEDTDLAFAVRATGRRVIYQPESTVIHFEGISAGTDLTSGMKRYQVVNREKFAAKWASALARQPAAGTPAIEAIHRADQPHMLIVDAHTPDPTRDSGSLRLVNMMQLLRELGWRITFAPDDHHATAGQINALGRLGVEVLCGPWSPSLAVFLRKHGGVLAAVILCRHYIAAPTAPLIRRLAPQARLVFDTVDLHFLREQRGAELAGNATLARQAQRARHDELALIRTCDATLVVSPVERDLLARELPQAHVELLSNVHQVFGRRASFEARNGLVFVGGFGHPPNVDAIHWLLDDIFPCVHATRPDITLHLIGSVPEAERIALVRSGVEIHGRIADIGPWMDGCRIALAPLRYGAGVKGKVNMAMSYGLPVVGTRVAAEGMQLQDGADILIADDAPGFAAAILRLYDDEALWLRLSDGGLDNVRAHFSFDAARTALTHVLAGCASPVRT